MTHPHSYKNISDRVPALSLLVPIVMLLVLLAAFQPDKGDNPIKKTRARTQHRKNGTSSAPQQENPKTWKWEYALPESVGLSSKKIGRLISLLKQKKTKKLLIIKDDKIVCEWYAPGYEDSVRRHYCASLSKALVGGMSLLLALNDQLIFPDAPACNYIVP